MHPVCRLLIALLLLASCTQAPSESRITASSVAFSRQSPDLVITMRSFARTVMTGPLTDGQGNITASLLPLLDNDDPAREMFGLFVACALPQDELVVGPVSDGELDYFGGFGLAPQWRTGPLD